MKLQDQFCTLEQAKKLKELGIIQDGYYCFLENSASKIEFGDINEMFEHHIHDYEISVHPDGFDGSFKEQSWIAFTAAELGVMLPSETLTIRRGSEESDIPNWEWENEGQGTGWGCFDNEAAARADHLIMLIEKKLTTAEEVNQRLTA